VIEMDTVDELRHRFLAAREAFRAIPVAADDGSPGPPDLATGEGWTRGNVLGHMADVLGFWSDQLQKALDGAPWIGRGDEGYAIRRAAIERGARSPQGPMREQVEQGTEKVLALLDRVQPADLSRVVEHRRAVETRPKTIGHLLDEILVSHFESHVRQLADLSQPPV